MGSGKSTLGKELATAIQRPYLDIDELIERETGMKISDIFYKFGEEHFRKIESGIWKKIIEENDGEIIISSGGGTLTFEKNWAVLQEKDVLTVFLDEQFETLWERIKNDPHRPLVAFDHLSEEEVKQKLFDLLIKRKPWYSKADIIISKPSQFQIDEIIHLLQNMAKEKEK
jgi:shikimate kinase